MTPVPSKSAEPIRAGERVDLIDVNLDALQRERLAGASGSPVVVTVGPGGFATGRHRQSGGQTVMSHPGLPPGCTERDVSRAADAPAPTRYADLLLDDPARVEAAAVEMADELRDFLVDAPLRRNWTPRLRVRDLNRMIERFLKSLDCE